jgi:hypothetical protein
VLAAAAAGSIAPRAVHAAIAQQVLYGPLTHTAPSAPRCMLGAGLRWCPAYAAIMASCHALDPGMQACTMHAVTSSPIAHGAGRHCNDCRTADLSQVKLRGYRAAHPRATCRAAQSAQAFDPPAGLWSRQRASLSWTLWQPSAPHDGHQTLPLRCRNRRRNQGVGAALLSPCRLAEHSGARWTDCGGTVGPDQVPRSKAQVTAQPSAEQCACASLM